MSSLARGGSITTATRSDISLRVADEAGAVGGADVHSQEGRSCVVPAVQFRSVERDAATVERTDVWMRVLLMVHDDLPPQPPSVERAVLGVDRLGFQHDALTEPVTARAGDGDPWRRVARVDADRVRIGERTLGVP